MEITANYHTHTFRCQHASGDARDYCQAALDSGLKVLGMSDHTPLPDDFWPHVRMTMAQLPDYDQAVEQARAEFPELTIWKGLECEYDPDYVNFYQEVLLEQYQFDYLVGGLHFFRYQGERADSFAEADTPARLRAFSTHCVAAMESGLFTFIAHPDLFSRAYLTWDENTAACARELCTAAKSLNLPLEINGLGLRKPPIKTPTGPRPIYPWPPFWEIAAEIGVTAIVNADAHRPKDVAANLEDGMALAQSLGLAVTQTPLDGA